MIVQPSFSFAFTSAILSNLLPYVVPSGRRIIAYTAELLINGLRKYCGLLIFQTSIQNFHIFSIIAECRTRSSFLELLTLSNALAQRPSAEIHRDRLACNKESFCKLSCFLRLPCLQVLTSLMYVDEDHAL